MKRITLILLFVVLAATSFSQTYTFDRLGLRDYLQLRGGAKITNVITDIGSDSTSDTKLPTVNAVRTWINSKNFSSGIGLSGLSTDKMVYATSPTTIGTSNLVSIGAVRLGIDGSSSTRGTLYFNDASNNLVQDDDAFIHFKIKDKGGYPSVAPRKMIYSIDPSAMGGTLTSKYGLYTFGVDYAPSINTPASDTGDVVASRGYNNPGYATYKPNEPSYTWQHELRYHQGAGPKPAIEDFTAFQTPQQNGSRGFRPYNWFLTHDGTQQQFAIRATRIQFGDTTSGTPQIDFTPGGPSTPGNFVVSDATVFTFLQPNYYPIQQSGVGGLIGGVTGGVGIYNGAFKFLTGGDITAPGSSGIMGLGSVTEPLAEGLQILTTSNEKQKWANTSGTLPLRLWYSGNTWQLRNNTSGNSIFSIDDRASNTALNISDAGNVGIGTASAPYRLYVASPSGTVSIGTAGLSTSGDIAHLLSGTTTGYIYTRQSYINATQGVIDAGLDNQNGSSTSAHSIMQLLTQAGGGSPMVRFQRNGVADSYWHIGTKRSTNRFTLTSNGNTIDDGDVALDVHPTTLKTTFSGLAGYSTNRVYADLTNNDFTTKAIVDGLITAAKPVNSTYTPDLFNITNVASSSITVCDVQYIEGFYYITGELTVDPTAAGDTQVDISLPVASGVSFTKDIVGHGDAYDILEPARIYGNTVNSRATVRFFATNLASRQMSITFRVKYQAP